MPAARYWRISRIETLAYGDLELSELALYEAGIRVDADATISAPRSPASGSLSDLSDENFDTRCAWPASDLFLPGFAIVWDFGSGVTKEVDSAGAASPGRDVSIHRLTLEHSSDGVSWTPHVSTSWAYWDAPNVISSLTDPIGDPTFGDVELLIEPSGAAIVDRSNSAKAVVAHGDAKPSASNFVFGLPAMDFDGSGDFLTLGSPADWRFTHDGTTAYTLEGIYKFNNFSAAPSLFGTTSGTSQVGILFYVNASRDILFAVFRGTPGVAVATLQTSGQPVPADGAPHHIAVVYDPFLESNHIKIFVDGTLVGQGSKTGNLPSDSNPANNMTMGAYADATYAGNFNGYAAEVRISKRSRYTENFAPPTEPFERNEGDIPENIDPTPYRSGARQSVVRIVENERPLDLDTLAVGLPRGHIDLEDGGTFQIVGTVKEVALPADKPLSRRVRLAYQDNGRVIRETFSDAAGDYAFEHIRGDRRLMAIAFDHAGNYRAVAADNLTAEPMP